MEKEKELSYLEKDRIEAEEEISAAQIDMFALQRFDPQIRLSYLEDHLPEILERLMDTLCGCISWTRYRDVDLQGFVSSLKPCNNSLMAICADEEAEFWISRVLDAKANGQNRNVWMLMYAAFRVCGISMHQLVFGKHYQSRIPVEQSQFIRNMRRLSKSQRETVMRKLRLNYHPVTNPYYILQRRLEELGEDVGYPMEKMLTVTFAKQRNLGVNYNNMMMRFMEEELSPVLDESMMARKGINNIRTLLYVCSVYDVGADRLLLPDYSDYAVDHDGTELSAREKKWLSAYQCAEPYIQREILVWCEMHI